MEVFTQYIAYLFDLLDSVCVYVGGYRFSLGGAIIFAVVCFCAVWFLHWLFNSDQEEFAWKKFMNY